MTLVPTIKIADITAAWVTALEASTDLSTYCTTEFGKDVTIFVNFNAKNKPKIDVTPLVAIYPGSKQEGIGNSDYTYTLGVSWVLKDVTGPTKTGKTYTMPYLEKLDYMGQIILQVLTTASSEHLVTDVQYSIEPTDFWPMIIGHMEMTISVPVTLGTGLAY